MTNPLIYSFLIIAFSALVGCSDEQPLLSADSENAAPAAEQQTTIDGRHLKWLEVGDPLHPAKWLAVLQTNNSQPESALVDRYRILLQQASAEYLESPRMIANRTSQLHRMLNDLGGPETLNEIIDGFLGLADNTRSQTEHIYSDVCSHYYNLRSSGLNRRQALAKLGGYLKQKAPTLGDANRSVRSGGQPDRASPSANKSGHSGIASAPNAQQPPTSRQQERRNPRKAQRLHIDVSKVTETLQEEDILTFVEEAVQLSNYEAPKRILRVTKLEPNEIRRVVCGGRECGAVAFFDDRTRTVYVDDRLDLERNVIATSYVIHEVVHYLQLLDGRLTPEMSCRARLELELEAYRVQNNYLAKSGSNHVVSTRLLHRMCDRG